VPIEVEEVMQFAQLSTFRVLDGQLCPFTAADVKYEVVL
jgi:hypothetical protein